MLNFVSDPLDKEIKIQIKSVIRITVENKLKILIMKTGIILNKVCMKG